MLRGCSLLLGNIFSELAHLVEEAAPVVEHVLLLRFLMIGEVPELIELVVETELEPVNNAMLDAVERSEADHEAPHQIFP